MTFGSLFSGFGGIDLGLEWAGMTCKWQVEIDDYCQKVLTKHWPDVPKYKDIKEVGKHNFETVDLIAGGWPCQPFSFAGKKRGREDERYLWPEVLRVVKDLKPAWFLGENVIGATFFLHYWKFDMEANGYEVQCFDIPASACGLPTMERHLWIIAKAIDIRCKRSKKDANKVKGFTEFSRTDQGNFSRWALPSARVCRVDEGIPSRVDRLKGLGNAVPPLLAEYIGKAIMHSNQSVQLSFA